MSTDFIEAPYLMYDNFPGAVGSIDGRLPVIGANPWTATGPGVATNLAGNGSWTSNVDASISYAEMNLGAQPGEIGFTFEWSGLVSSVYPVAANFPVIGQFLTNMAHCQITSTIFSWTMAVNNTSPTFVPTVYAWNNSNTYTVAANTIYTVRLFIEPPYIHGFLIGPTGNIIGWAVFSDSKLAGVIGNYMFIEIGDTHLRYHSVWARQKTTQSLSIQNFLGGLASTPIGLSNPVPGAFTAVAIGTQSTVTTPGPPVTPAGIFYAQDDGSFAYQNPTIARTNGDASFEIKALTTGYKSQAKITNGAGASIELQFDYGYNTNFIDPTGTWLIKPTYGQPYFEGNIGIGGSGGPFWTSGAGAPSADAPIGSLYSRTDGGVTTSLYVKTAAGAGAGNWTPK